MPLPLHRHLDTVQAFEPLEAPTSGWRRWGLMDGGRHGLMGLGSWLSQSTLCPGVHPQRPGHHHAEPCHAGGLFDQQRRDETPRGCEQPPAPVALRLTLGGDADRGITARAGVEMGAKAIAGLGGLGPLSRLVIGMDGGLDGPRDGLERRVRCGTAGAHIALVCRQRRGRPAVRRPALGQRCAGIGRGVGGAKALGLQGQERLGNGRVCARGGVLQRGVSTCKSGPCIHPPPRWAMPS